MADHIFDAESIHVAQATAAAHGIFAPDPRHEDDLPKMAAPVPSLVMHEILLAAYHKEMASGAILTRQGQLDALQIKIGALLQERNRLQAEIEGAKAQLEPNRRRLQWADDLEERVRTLVRNAVSLPWLDAAEAFADLQNFLGVSPFDEGDD